MGTLSDSAGDSRGTWCGVSSMASVAPTTRDLLSAKHSPLKLGHRVHIRSQRDTTTRSARSKRRSAQRRGSLGNEPPQHTQLTNTILTVRSHNGSTSSKL